MDIGRYITDPLTWVGKLGGLKSSTSQLHSLIPTNICG